MTSFPAIYKLPEELLLQIAFQLPDSATPKHLKTLCLTSKTIRPAAQEALHTTAKLSISCGCHPKVNPVVKLLRTLFERPDLAPKVKTLRFRTVRKNIARLYEEQSFDLQRLRARCLLELKVLGYNPTHPWIRSLDNGIESAFAGVLLILLPNLNHLDLWVKDHYRGPPSSECISGLFGTMSAPEVIVRAWDSVQHLTTGDTHALKCGVAFNNLKSLDLKTISIGTVLRLNGPRSLQGTEHLRDLSLTASIQFADRPLVEKAEINFHDLLDALGCDKLSSLKILLVNDGYHIGGADLMTQLDAGYFMDQLSSVQDTLEDLAITSELPDDEIELEWLLEMWRQPKESLKSFVALKHLVLPQAFLFATGSEAWVDANEYCRATNLPSTLESLEILYPHEDVEFWVADFMKNNSDDMPSISNLKEITLTCRDEVGTPSSFFTTEVAKIWWTLSADLGIETFALCQTEGSRMNLAELYHDERLEESEGETDEDQDGWSDEDEEMPDLIDPIW
ncbi:hypothetical protein BKA66DRAFT_510598 [Pyrenochaeta sp. MPI-SDFR-AT-0127]|nr:hypothetical protein BKA66DRAFT_510598 [Pyrenochaeta sp. MPI-SDFR-AT-0127]